MTTSCCSPQRASGAREGVITSVGHFSEYESNKAVRNCPGKRARPYLDVLKAYASFVPRDREFHRNVACSMCELRWSKSRIVTLHRLLAKRALWIACSRLPSLMLFGRGGVRSS